MKKLLSIFVALVIVCTTFVTASFAAGGGTLVIETKTVKSTDTTFKVKFDLKDSPKIESIGVMDITYDKTNFELVSGEWKFTAVTVVKDNYGETFEGVASAALKDQTALSGTVFEATFKVLSTAKVGTTEISCSYSDSAAGERAATPGKITLECGAHKYADNWTQKSAATCTAAEKLNRFCTVCGGGEQIKDGKAALGHDLKVNTTPATCEADGKEVTTCSRCDYTSTKTLPKLGHKFTKYTQVKAPTCTEVGKEEATCDHEGCTKTDTRDIKALGHKFGEFKETKAPTCTEKGTKTAACENAGCTETKTEDIPALGHEVKEWTVTEEATLEKEGKRTGTCDRCKETVEEDIPKLTKEVKTGDDAKVEVVVDADEPFTGYTEVKVSEVATSEADKVDGKDVVGGYKIDIVDADTNESVAADKKVNAKIKLTDAMKAAYKDFDVAIDGTALGATVTEDGYLTFTAEAGKLAKVVVIGTKIETNGGDNGNNNSGDNGNNGSSTSPKTGEATGAALAVTLFAAAAAGVVLSKKKRG